MPLRVLIVGDSVGLDLGQPLVNALGGIYLELDNPTGLAPLKALTDSEEDIGFLAALIRGR